MKIEIISVGTLGKYHDKLAENYRKMTSFGLKEIILVPAKDRDPSIVKKKEAAKILAKINDASMLIVLDERGSGLTSFAFSKLFANAQIQGKNIQFIIGGAYGLDESIRSRVAKIIKLSDMTIPHKMAKIILLEQIYRAQTILQNHPYHK